MKQVFKILIGLLPTVIFGQMTTPQSFTMPHSEIGYKINMGSTGMNNDMLFKLGLGGYISPSTIAINEEGMGKISRVGSISSWQAEHVFKAPLFNQDKKIMLRSIGISYNNASSAVFSTDAWRLLFRGNSPYLGQTLNLGKLNYSQWTSSRVHSSFSLSSKASRISSRISLKHVSVGLNLIHNYRRARFGNSSLYTDTNANYIDTRLQGNYVLGNSQIIQGLGLDIGTEIAIGQHLNLKINGLGIARMTKLAAYKLNSTENFTQDYKNEDELQVRRISQAQIQRSQLNSGAWVNGQRDTVINTFVPNKEEISATLLLPFQLEAQYQSFDKKHIVSAYYMYLNGMRPQLTYQHRLINTAYGHIYSSLSLGGFDTYDLGVQLKIKPKLYTHIDIDLRGIEALLAPSKTHGTYIGLRIKQYWK
jgi:hypothetical protein